MYVQMEGKVSQFQVQAITKNSYRQQAIHKTIRTSIANLCENRAK